MKEELYLALLSQKKQQDLNRLRDFRPNPGFQEKFFKSNAAVRLITAGNQSGKTHCSAVEAAHFALGTHPYKKIKTPNVGIIVSGLGFQTGIIQVVVPKLEEVVGSEDIVDIKKNSQGIPIKIVWRTGSITYLMSSEQDDMAFEGKKCDWAWADEPIRRSIFVAIKRGFLTTNGRFWFSCTPLDEPWMYEQIYMPGVNGVDKDIAVFQGSSDENVHISEEAKKEFKKHLTEDEVDARWYGKFRHLSGRVFKAYNPEVHRIPAFDIPPHWPVWLSVDPHRNKPHAVLFLAVSPQGVKYICNEIYKSCRIETLADYILGIGSQYNIVQRLIDTSAQEDGWSKKSAREILQKNGVPTKLAQKRNLKASGIILINELFGSDELFVMEHCVRTHRELQNQIYKKNKRDNGIIMEEPEKKFDDMTDNLRYVLVERPTYRSSARIKTQEAPYVR